MHHKYVVRDGADVWTGSTNWTDDAFSREENVIVRVSSPDVATRYAHNFEQLWTKGRLESSGGEGASASLGRGVDVQPLFSPRGPSLAHRVAERIAAAHHRVRILSPVITSGAVLGTLAEIAGRASFDLVGAYDATQMREVVGQWQDVAAQPLEDRRVGRDPPAPLGQGLDAVERGRAVCTTTCTRRSWWPTARCLTGSYNLSRGGEENAENVLHIRSGALAERFGGFVERVAARYATMRLGVPDGRHGHRLDLEREHQLAQEPVQSPLLCRGEHRHHGELVVGGRVHGLVDLARRRRG